MRLREFANKPLTINEFAATDVEKVVQALAAAAQNTDQNTEEHKKVIAQIDSLLAAVKKTQPQTATKTVKEDLSVTDQKKILALLASVKNPQERSALETILSNPQNAKAIFGIINQAKKAGSEEQITKEVEYNKQVNALIDRLVNKVLGSMDALNNAYAENSQSGEDINSEKPKSLPSNTALKEQIKSAISSSFKTLHIEFGKNTAEYNTRKKQILEFMSAAAQSGIFSFSELIKGGLDQKGNIFNLIPKQFREIGNIVGQQLLSFTAGTGAGSWGPGELGLCILGSPVHKASKKGDLVIDGKAVELKASRTKDKGARLNTEVLLNGSAAKPTYDKIIADLASRVNLKPDDLLTYSVTRNGRVVSTGKYKSLNSFSSQTIKQLNSYVFKPLADSQLALKTLQQVIAAVLKPEAHKFIKTDYLRPAVNADGTINYVNFIEGYVRILWDCYHEFDGVGTMLILNPITGSYTISNSSDDLINQVKAGVVSFSGGIDFGDKQSKASPQLGIE